MTMDDLVERIKASVEKADSDPWFPEFTTDLAARAWECLRRDIGLTPHNYGTGRLLSRNISAHREVITSLRASSEIAETASTISIEALTQERSARYRSQDVHFYSADAILNTSIVSCIEDALATINQVPSLMRTVVSLVRSLHVIEPEEEDHDVSFSEPHVPFSVFVSVPGRRIPNDTMRVAEAIVHEAMHLQLTLIERVVPLIVPMSVKYYSPWKREYRDAEGILQAVFVFATIDWFLSELFSVKTAGVNKPYIHHRRNEIRDQICQVRSFRHSDELTEAGFRLVTWLTDLDRHNRSSAISA
jgi:hypothetical protein